jgi:hypothetical protein
MRAAIARALEGGARLTRDQLAAVLDRTGIDRVGQRMPYILIHCELEAVICSGVKGTETLITSATCPFTNRSLVRSTYGRRG